MDFRDIWEVEFLVGIDMKEELRIVSKFPVWVTAYGGAFHRDKE